MESLKADPNADVPWPPPAEDKKSQAERLIQETVDVTGKILVEQDLTRLLASWKLTQDRKWPHRCLPRFQTQSRSLQTDASARI
jgi:hypothetical protein